MTNLIVRDANSNSKELMVGGDGTINNPFYSIHEQRESGEIKQIFYQKVDSIGDGTGTINMNVNGSVTPVVFRLKPPVDKVYRLAQWTIIIGDSGAFDAGGWGNNGGTHLPNGVILQLVKNGVVTNFVTPLTCHCDIASITSDFNHHAFGSGNEFIVAKWVLTESGQYIRLDGANGDELRITVRDDLTFLVRQEVLASGYIE